MTADSEPKTALATQEPVKATQHLTSGDAALQLLTETGSVQALDEEKNRRLLRRIDFHIMPLIFLVYFLQYIDKSAISYASVTGLKMSAHLVGDQFNWVASIFY